MLLCGVFHQTPGENDAVENVCRMMFVSASLRVYYRSQNYRTSMCFAVIDLLWQVDNISTACNRPAHEAKLMVERHDWQHNRMNISTKL